MHSQVVGIVWISVILLLIAGLALFLPKDSTATAEGSDKMASDTVVLAKMEDSVYAARRKVNTPLPPSRGDGLSKGYSRGDGLSEGYSRGDGLSEGYAKGGVLSEGYSRGYGFYSRGNENSREHDGEGYWDKGRNDRGYNTQYSTYKRQPLSVELNTADTMTLQLLHGIGPAYSRRIVRYREKLGGFTSKEQLLEVYGFTPELLNHIAPHITVDTLAVSKISINSVTLKQLIKHPYIEYYQARDIIELRNHGVRYNNADDLRAVPSMADSTLQRLLPYISFD